MQDDLGMRSTDVYVMSFSVSCQVSTAEREELLLDHEAKRNEVVQRLVRERGYEVH
jgi:hypothetical protein